jgi:hypothetical protein
MMTTHRLTRAFVSAAALPALFALAACSSQQASQGQYAQQAAQSSRAQVAQARRTGDAAVATKNLTGRLHEERPVNENPTGRLSASGGEPNATGRLNDPSKPMPASGRLHELEPAPKKS